jgi:hypothetical protein
MDREPHTLQCFEVWGGNTAVRHAVGVPGLDAWVLSRPHAGEESGGDIHYLSSCATGRIGRVLLADVSGHGHRASAIAVSLRGLMRRFVNYVDHTKLVSTLNSEFLKIASPGVFATAAVLTWWAPRSELTLTSAGHPPPLLYEARTRRWRVLQAKEVVEITEASEPHDAPLGIVEETRYERTMLKLGVGDMVLLYSDGLVEACRRGEHGREELGVRGLCDLANSAASVEPAAMLALLHEGARAFGTLDDDATLILLRRNEQPAPKGSTIAGVRATLRIAREALRDWLRGKTAALPEARVDNVVGAWVDRANRSETPNASAPRGEQQR